MPETNNLEHGQVDRIAYWKGKIETEELSMDQIAKKLAELENYKKDGLTGLPQRVLFMEELSNLQEGAENRNNKLYILMFDLNNLKKVNDSMGHSEGDKYLLSTVAKIKECTNQGDLIGRWGGDEFIVAKEVDKSNYQKSVQNFLQKLVSSFGDTLAIGIAEHVFGKDINETIKKADDGMYMDKDVTKKINA